MLEITMETEKIVQRKEREEAKEKKRLGIEWINREAPNEGVENQRDVKVRAGRGKREKKMTKHSQEEELRGKNIGKRRKKHDKKERHIGIRKPMTGIICEKK